MEKGSGAVNDGMADALADRGRTVRLLSEEHELRTILGQPSDLVKTKIVSRLNHLTRQFIERSPFLCLATSDAAGCRDVSPRGDAPVFVRILDDQTLLIPDRPGNRLADSLCNVLANPRVGLLFILPGIDDTFRVNGRACITDDEDLLAPSQAEAKPPRLGILVAIEEAYTQCGKAFLRSSLWDGTRHLQAYQQELPMDVNATSPDLITLRDQPPSRLALATELATQALDRVISEEEGAQTLSFELNLSGKVLSSVADVDALLDTLRERLLAQLKENKVKVRLK